MRVIDKLPQSICVVENLFIPLKDGTQVAPYAPLEIKRVDLDNEPVAGIIGHLKSSGKLVLDRDPSAEQAPLF